MNVPITPKIPSFRASDLAGLPVPPRRWVLEGLIPASTVTLLTGDGGCGKTSLALQIAVAAVRGVKIFGRSVEAGGAIVVTAEDDRQELHRRLAALADADEFDIGDLATLQIVPAGEMVSAILAIEAKGFLEWTKVHAALVDLVRKLRPIIVVLDPVSELFGANENDRSLVASFVGGLRRMAAETGCAILLLSHPSVGGIADRTGRSGSTGWANAARQRLFLSRIEDDDDARSLTVTKANYGPMGTRIDLRYVAGRFVLDKAGVPGRVPKEIGEVDETFLAILRKLAARGERVSHKPSVTWAPKVAEQDPAAAGIKRSAFDAAMRRLLDAGRLRIVEDGPASRRREYLEVV